MIIIQYGPSLIYVAGLKRLHVVRSMSVIFELSGYLLLSLIPNKTISSERAKGALSMKEFDRQYGDVRDELLLGCSYMGAYLPERDIMGC